MILGLRAPVWFGIALAASALCLWCLVTMIEAQSTTSGYLWGLIVFGAVALFCGIVAIIAQSSSGGFARSRDALTKRGSKPPARSAGRDLKGAGTRPMGSGEIPRPVSGRQIK